MGHLLINAIDSPIIPYFLLVLTALVPIAGQRHKTHNRRLLLVGEYPMASMNFIDVKGAGGAEQLIMATGDVPACRPGEVLIRVLASGINRPDILQRLGFYAPPADASPIIGLEAAGEIVALGAGVDRWSIGDRVCALCNGGAYAEYVAVPAGQCLPIPEGLSMLEAASLPETFFTVWSNLFQRARLTAGDSLLVHGGTSGIGVTAIQLAAASGVRVFASARSAAKCRACEALGAERAIDSTRDDYVAEVMALTDTRGVDVILDMVGGDYLQKNIACAALDGRLVSIAFLAGARVELDMMPLMLKRLTITGSTLRPQSVEAKAHIARELLEHAWPLLASGAITPQVHASFALAEVAEAHRLMESNQHVGKIVLQVAT
jgi:NADPH2:quinone reductase